jgi:NAD(P)-dependent dehydrogenase (short-subunit alcohol dehydrogenase family)
LDCAHNNGRIIEPCGAIVNASSTTGLRGLPFRSAYVTNKHRATRLIKFGGEEFAEGANIRINAMCLGTTRTPLSKTKDERIAETLAEGVSQMRPIG